MSGLVEQITAVRREHRLATTSWGQTHCWCQQNTAARDFGMSYERHDAHVAEQIADEIEKDSITTIIYATCGQGCNLTAPEGAVHPLAWTCGHRSSFSWSAVEEKP